MDATGVTVLSEIERLGEVSTTLVVGELSPEALDALPGKITACSEEKLLGGNPISLGRYDLVICMQSSLEGGLERRTLGCAIGIVADSAVISVQMLGQELAIPLIELKRGLLLDEPSLGYRVYGRRKVQA